MPSPNLKHKPVCIPYDLILCLMISKVLYGDVIMLISSLINDVEN